MFQKNLQGRIIDFRVMRQKNGVGVFMKRPILQYILRPLIQKMIWFFNKSFLGRKNFAGVDHHRLKIQCLGKLDQGECDMSCAYDE